MSIEYYTGVEFEKAKAKLQAAAKNRYTFETPLVPHYVPECREFMILHLESHCGIWCLREARSAKRFASTKGLVVPPLGTLTFVRFVGNSPVYFMPWVEKTLGIRVMSEIGFPWEQDL